MKWVSASDATCGRWVMQITCCPGQPAQPLADGACRVPADPGVDLIEDQASPCGVAGEADQREHDPRELTAGGRLLERRARHPRVRRHHELDGLGAERSEAVRVRVERTSSRAPSIASSASSAATRFESRPAAAATAPSLGGGRPLGGRRGESALERRCDLGAVGEPLDLGAARLRMGENRLDRAAVLALEPLERVEPLRDPLEPPRLGLDPLQVAAQPAARSSSSTATPEFAPRVRRARGRRPPSPSAPHPPRRAPGGRRRRPRPRR